MRCTVVFKPPHKLALKLKYSVCFVSLHVSQGAIEYYGGLSPEVSRAEALVADIKTMLLQDIKPDLLIRCADV